MKLAHVVLGIIVASILLAFAELPFVLMAVKGVTSGFNLVH